MMGPLAHARTRDARDVRRKRRFEFTAFHDHTYGKRSSGDDFFDHVTGDVGQSLVSPVVPVREPRVIDAQEVEDGRVKIVDMGLFMLRA